MPGAVSPAKVLLLAVHFAAHADIESLAKLCQHNASTLHRDVLLRILLTYLPELTRPSLYVAFLKQVADGEFQDTDSHAPAPDSSPVADLTEAEATKRARRLHLRSLTCQGTEPSIQGDALGCFLVLRARSMNTETGVPSQLPELLLPFIHRNTFLYTWTSTTVLPYVKKEQATGSSRSLPDFEALSDAEASNHLLLQPDPSPQRQLHVDRDLREILAPWLYSPDRWREAGAEAAAGGGEANSTGVKCEGWQAATAWLLSQAATTSWPVALQALEKWGGIDDVHFGHGLTMSLPKQFQHHSRHTYAATALACVYSIQDTSLECLSRLYAVVARLRCGLARDEKYESLEEALAALPDFSLHDVSALLEDRSASLARNNLLDPNNPLTCPSAESTRLLLALILSAYIFARHGHPLSVRRVRDLTFSRDVGDQRAAFAKTLRAIDNQASIRDDEYMLWARKRLLWLRGWFDDAACAPRTVENGPLCTIGRESMDADFLKLMLSTGRYHLARSLFEDAHDKPLSAETIQEVVYTSALAAFDNATRPDRARGGLKQCDEILRAFPATVGPSLAGTRRMRALLKATHALSGYRLVLRAGEFFSPVVLRVHSDPISIIAKILEQNPGAYTRLQEFLEMGANISEAGLPWHSHHSTATGLAREEPRADNQSSERRITAFCIQAALSEEDFETAYSYVASRIATRPGTAGSGAPNFVDEWSWKAALQAGQYIRTERSKRPTHLGTASGNPIIRHLQQRIECLATALRFAPTSELQDILQSFRRCEEQLDSATREEAAREAAWDAEADAGRLPGAFGHSLTEDQRLPRTANASAAARQVDEAPMSLFDLSRATARIAQRNITTISGLQSITRDTDSDERESHGEPRHRVRKRDQLREAATGTLVSGVGWLIGAPVNQNRTPRGEM